MLTGLLLLPLALAQEIEGGATPPLNAQVFHPTLDATSTFGLDDTVVRDRAFTARALFQYAYQPLTWTSPTGEVTALLSDLVQLDATAGYGIGPFRAGIHLPVYLWTAGTEGGQAGLGDLALDGKIRFVKRTAKVPGLAVDGRLAVPTSTARTALGSEGAQGEIALVVDKSFGDLLLLANLGARFQPEVLLENATWGSQGIARLGAGFATSPRAGLSAELAAQSTFADFANPATSPAEVLVGGWHRLGDAGLVLRGGLGTGLVDAVGAPRFRALLAFAWEPDPERDRDADGVADRRDDCRDVPEDADGWEDEDGCPEPTHITVRVVDPAGALVAGGRLVFNGTVGGPEVTLDLEPGPYPARASATDYTGAEEEVLVPPGPPVEHAVTIRPFGRLVVHVTDEEGAPVEAAITLTGRGMEGSPVLASEWARPLQPGTYKVEVRRDDLAPFVEPIVIFEGKEARLDVRMRVPKVVVDVARKRIDIHDSIYFDVDEATIRPESYPLLNEIAQVILDHPELLKIRIEGHTDSRGPADHNLDLSRRRAAALKIYLVERGVTPERLETEGFGESRPLVKGNKEDAWARNRRVDFFVLERRD